MRMIQLPGTDLEVSQFVLGACDFGTVVPQPDVERLVARYVEMGGTFIDTAHVYAFWQPGGMGASERSVGAAIRSLGLADRVVVASKGCHPAMSPGYERDARYLSAEMLESDVTESLERLGIDCLDLYYFHRDDPTVPVGDLLRWMEGQRRRGRVRHFGASNWSASRLSEAAETATRMGVPGFCVSQVQWSLAVPNWQVTADPTIRWLTPDDEAVYRSLNLPVAAYSATSNGYFAANQGADGSYGTAANAGRRERARRLATLHRCTPTQVALAWLTSRYPLALPIFSTRSVAHLEEAMGAAAVDLRPEEVTRLAQR